jgi:hypothetical protein
MCEILIDREIKVKAPLSGYRLVLGTRGPAGLPIEAFLRLYAVAASGIVKPMNNILDILSLVQEIRSEEEAMELISITTAPDTHFLFPGSPYLDLRICTALEHAGDVIESSAIAAGYQHPACTAQGDGFDITRDLVRLDPGDTCVLIRRSEHVSRSGTYNLVSEVPIGPIDCSDILLPDYE